MNTNSTDREERMIITVIIMIVVRTLKIRIKYYHKAAACNMYSAKFQYQVLPLASYNECLHTIHIGH